MAYVTSSAETNITEQCASISSLINSDGAFGEIHPLAAYVPRLELSIFAVFFFSNAFHFILKRWGIPVLVSQILAGILLGRTGLLQHTDYQRIMFIIDSEEILGTVAGLGFQLSIFLTGVKIDLSMMGKTGKKAFYFGVLSTVIPVLFGIPTMVKVSNHWGLDGKSRMALFYAMALYSVTPFSVIVSHVSELKIVNSELGRLGLSSASVSDMLTIFLALCCFFQSTAYVNVTAALRSMILTIAFVIVVASVIRPAMIWVIKQTPEGRPVKDLYVDIIIIGALVSGLISNYIGVYIFLGSIAFGLAVPTGPPLASAIVEKLECAVSGALVPLVVALCTMRVDLLAINFDDNLMKSTAIVIAVVILAKFAGCLVPPLSCKLPKRDSLAFALIMSTKGMIELVSYAYIRERKEITEGMFSFLTVTILLTTIIFSILVNWLYDPSRKYAGYQKRNIMHSKEMRILACISRPDNINSIINFLQASCSAEESPLVVDVLHLIKISGRSSPLFISHKMQRKTVSHRSYSENVIRFFNHFQDINSEAVSINVFTAISPPKFMHEDICTLALDKLTSFIVLPFHKKWLLDGSPVESEDMALRTLNCSILERAPCSVGILIDRGNLGTMSWASSKEPSLLVAMIFFGGNDDREALVLAKHMAHHKNISLTVIRFIVSDDVGEIDWEKMLDSEALRDIKVNNIAHQHVQYVEKVVKDGLETAAILHSLAIKYNLLIVGRRKDIETPQTSGVDKLIKYAELGVAGSLLTTMDVNERYSVLVVQQQITL